MISILPGEVATAHIALLVGFPFVRNLSDADPSFAARRPLNEQIPPSSPWVNSKARRALDIAGAALALFLLTPLIAICWLMVRFSSPGPVFFRQYRAGRHGSEFELFKFRSMRTESFLRRPGHTVYGDGRITPAGAFLRRYKLDEIPQFWNVLKGDMSLVGPRPKLAHHEGLTMPYRPGLTGHATLAFRHEERMLLEVPGEHIETFYDSVVKPIKVRLDINYMQNATFSSDIRVIWRTFLRCVHCSDDARRELAALLDQHAPDYSNLLERERGAALPLPLHQASGFMAELNDDFAGDLDDAA